MIDDVELLAHSRPGFELVGFAPVALPFWRLRLRVEILAQRRISVLEEFVLRAALDADPQLTQIKALLGLDEITFDDVVATIVSREWASVDKRLRLKLTDKGREGAHTLIRERSVDRVISFDFDGLLRRPTLLDIPLEPQQQRALGLIGLPAPANRPELREVDDARNAIQAIIRRSGGQRDQQAQLLAVKGIIRTERIYQEARLAIFRSDAGDLQAAPILRGVVSTEHEQALAAPDVFHKLRLTSQLARGRKFDQLLPAELRERYSPSSEAHFTELRTQALQADADGRPSEKLDLQVRDARRDATIRRLPPNQHVTTIRRAIRTAKSRVLVSTPMLIDASIEPETIKWLRKLLQSGGTLTIIHSENELPERLEKVLSDYPRTASAHTARVSVSTLVKDHDLAIRTLFPIFASYGQERPFRDERGWLVVDPPDVEHLAEEILEGVPETAAS